MTDLPLRDRVSAGVLSGVNSPRVETALISNGVSYSNDRGFQWFILKLVSVML